MDKNSNLTPNSQSCNQFPIFDPLNDPSLLPKESKMSLSLKSASELEFNESKSGSAPNRFVGMRSSLDAGKYLKPNATRFKGLKHKNSNENRVYSGATVNSVKSAVSIDQSDSGVTSDLTHSCHSSFLEKKNQYLKRASLISSDDTSKNSLLSADLPGLSHNQSVRSMIEQFEMISNKPSNMSAYDSNLIQLSQSFEKNAIIEEEECQELELSKMHSMETKGDVATVFS